MCGRSHGMADVEAALQAIRAAQPQSWSLDLMSGLPRLTVSSWQDSLAAALAARPDHISVYDLQVRLLTNVHPPAAYRVAPCSVQAARSLWISNTV